MILDLLLLAGSLALVLIGARWLVSGASSLAKKLGVSELVIGLTVVAFGTSSPELTVNIFSALKGSTDIAIGNVLGSNIFNILFILGVTALIYPLPVKHNTKWKEIPFSLLAAVVLAFAVNDIWIDGGDKNLLTRIDGLMLLGFFVIFMVYVFEMAKHDKDEDSEEPIKQMTSWKALFFIAIGLAGLFFGGKYLVQSAVSLAREFGLSEKVIGLTIVAIGTSVPELATSVVAALKKKADIAVGNVVGSNIFNIFFILGTTSLIKPLPFAPDANIDLGMAILASLLLFIAAMTLGMKKIIRLEGAFFLAVYIGYVVYLLAA